MKNVMFRDTPIPKVSKSAFDLSHEHKTSFQIGELVPFMWYDVLPGDKFKIKSEVLVKMAPLLRPLLHRVDVHTHFFYVPFRLLMRGYAAVTAGWEDFITGDPESLFTTDELPYITISNANKAYFYESTLNDYLGLPTVVSGTTISQDIDINCLPQFAYHLIYNDYYRDENLISPVVSKTAGASAGIDLVGGDKNSEIASICPAALYRRAYEKDYFRGALPTAYTGAAEDVELDLDVFGYGVPTADLRITLEDYEDGGSLAVGDITAVAGQRYMYEAGSGHTLQFADGYQQPLVSTLEIMELRRAQAITRWLEAERRGGHRYQEMLLGVWGVVSDNAELDIPQYIGGGKQYVQVSSVLNQSQSLDPTAGVNDGAGAAVIVNEPQSYETGRALSVGKTNTAGGYFKEHGIIMGIMSVLPRTAYKGGIEKFWRKADREDFFIPQLQNIGDQAIQQSEIAYDATGSDADNVFGYSPRWSEYKFKNSTVSSAFQSTLADFHMATLHDTSGAGPDLNRAFIECLASDDENTRIFAVTGAEDKLYVETYNDVMAIRPMYIHDIPK